MSEAPGILMKRVLFLHEFLNGVMEKIAMVLNRGLKEGGFNVDCSSISIIQLNNFNIHDMLGIVVSENEPGKSKNLDNFLSKLMREKLENKLGIML